jgi:hypothetical protein
MAIADDKFTEAVNQWDLETLYLDLASAKGKRLTPVEKLHLRGLLCGHSPTEIAQKLNKNLNGLETDLCATLYKYVKSLIGKHSERIENWRNIAEWLDEAGYKRELSANIPVNSLLPDKSIVKISNIKLEDRSMLIVINLKIPTTESPDTELENIDLSKDIIDN